MKLKYTPNPKHKEPWQPGRKGLLCPHHIPLDPQKMLEGSIEFGEKRYATFGGIAFVAQRHMQQGDETYWHGYPEGWEYIPPHIRNQWITADKSLKRKIKKYWTRESVEKLYEAAWE